MYGSKKSRNKGFKRRGTLAALSLIVSIPLLFGCAYPSIKYNKWDKSEIDRLINNANNNFANKKIEYISQYFIDTPYKHGTLNTDPLSPERLVINLKQVDCFTYLDYVTAMTISENADDFIDKIKRVRYFDSDVSYEKRKHFFTDWANSDGLVKDITPSLPGSVATFKIINRKSAKESWLENVPQKSRMVSYIPKEKITEEVIDMLKTGDFIGAYSTRRGLDVTHVGILIKNERGVFFRNASSRKSVMRVTDYNMKEYINNINGIVVLRKS